MIKIDENIIDNKIKLLKMEAFNKNLENLTIPTHLETYILDHARNMVNGFDIYEELSEICAIKLLENQDLLKQAIYDHWLSEYTDIEQGIFWEVGDYLIRGEDELLYITDKDDEYFRTTNKYEEDYAYPLYEIYNLTNISYLYRTKEYEKNDGMVVDHDLKVCYYENPKRIVGFSVPLKFDIAKGLRELDNRMTPKKEQVTVTIDKDLYEQFLKHVEKNEPRNN